MSDQKLLEEAYALIIKEQYNKSGIASAISDIKGLLHNIKSSSSSTEDIVNTFIRAFKQIILKYNFGEGERKCVIIGVHQDGVINNKQCSDLLKYFSHEDKPDFRRF